MRVRSCVMPRSPSIGLRTTGRAGSKSGRAARKAASSFRIALKRAKCESSLCAGAPSPCVTISSIARCAEARSSIRNRPGRPNSSGPTCAWPWPTNTRSSPSCSGEPREPVQRAVVQVALARIVLRRGRQHVRARDPAVVIRVAEAGAVRDVEALGPLDEHEVVERGVAERHQRHDDVGGKVTRAHRERGTPQVRRGADRGEQVVHQRQVQHFLQRHPPERAAPALDRRQLGRRHALARVALQRPLRVQVRAHHRVLELRGLAQQVDEFFAILDDDLL